MNQIDHLILSDFYSELEFKLESIIIQVSFVGSI